jgi:hypothetical protein
MITCCHKKARRHGGHEDDIDDIDRVNPTNPPSPGGPDGRPDPSNSSRSSLPVEVERRMKQDGLEEYLTEASCDCDERRIVYYLYGREMYWELPVAKRVVKIKAFVADGAIERMKLVLAFFVQGSSSSSTPRDGDPIRSQEQHRVWRKTQEKILRFEGGKGDVDAGFTIFLKNGIPYIQFLQGSTSGYIAAPAALVSYLLAIAERRNKVTNTANSICRVEPIDTHRYVRHRFTNDDELLERRVVGNHGGSSQDVLRDMVGSTEKSDFAVYKISVSDPHQREMLSNFVTGFVLEAIRRYGPALVSSFDVKSVKNLRASKNYPKDDNVVVYMPSFDVDSTGEDVLNYRNLGRYGDDISIKQKIDAFESANEDVETTHSAGGKSDGADGDRGGGSGEIDESKSKDASSPSLGDEGAADRPHAMILIGSRSDDADGQSKHWFLLQNSWESMPVLEVSDSFMARHLEGDLRFVCRDVTASGVAASGDISTVAGLHHECNLDDGGEEAEDLIEEGPGDY